MHDEGGGTPPNGLGHDPRRPEIQKSRSANDHQKMPEGAREQKTADEGTAAHSDSKSPQKQQVGAPKA